MKKIGQSLAASFKAFFYFISSKMFLKNIMLIFFVLVSVFVLSFVFVHFFTRHDRYIETPDLVGLTLPEARSKFTDINFNVDSTSKNDAIPALTILNQSPRKSEKIKKGRTVYISVNPINIPLENVPNIYGKQLKVAMIQLEGKGFKGKVLRYENDRADSTVLKMIYFNTKGDSIVLKNERKANQLPKGTTIYMVVARGLGAEVMLPDLRCNTYDVARFLLEGSELKIGLISTQGVVADSANAYVIRQYPDFIENRPIKKGMEVNIWLSASPPADCSVDKDFISTKDTAASNNTAKSGYITPPKSNLRVRH